MSPSLVFPRLLITADVMAVSELGQAETGKRLNHKVRVKGLGFRAWLSGLRACLRYDLIIKFLEDYRAMRGIKEASQGVEEQLCKGFAA